MRNRSTLVYSDSREEVSMPTRRTLELVVITIIATRPIFGMIKLWSHKTVATAPHGSVAKGAAEIGNVIA